MRCVRLISQWVFGIKRSPVSIPITFRYPNYFLLLFGEPHRARGTIIPSIRGKLNSREAREIKRERGGGDDAENNVCCSPQIMLVATDTHSTITVIECCTHENNNHNHIYKSHVLFALLASIHRMMCMFFFPFYILFHPQHNIVRPNIVYITLMYRWSINTYSTETNNIYMGIGLCALPNCYISMWPYSSIALACTDYGRCRVGPWRQTHHTQPTNLLLGLSNTHADTFMMVIYIHDKRKNIQKNKKNNS